VRAVALALLLAAPHARAQAPPPASPARVRVEVTTIHAAKGPGPGSAPEKLAERLSRAFPGYAAFHLLGTAGLDLAAGGSGKAGLPDGSEVEVAFLGAADKMLRLRVAIPPRLATEVRVADGGTFYQAGMEYRGGVLILAIRAGSPAPGP
jgi:hypothetical protein